MFRKLFGRQSTRTFTAVLVDPFAREIRNVDLPTYPVNRHGEVADQDIFRRVMAQWNGYIGDGITPRTTSFRHDCAAAIDDEGLLRADAAYWRLEIGPEDTRDMRGGRYLIYGVDGSPVESAIPNDLDIGFWRQHVRWVEADEARTWCRERGIESSYW